MIWADFGPDDDRNDPEIEPALLSEQSLSDWLRPEEDEAWNDLLKELNSIDKSTDNDPD